MVVRSKKTKQNRSGFTLIEVMGACFLLAIISVGAMQYSVQAFRIIHQQGNARAALLRAEQRMELIKAVPVTAFFWDTLAVDEAYYLSNYNKDTGLFAATGGKPSEPVDVNKTDGTIWSLVRRVETSDPHKSDVSGTAVPANGIEIEVFVSYGERPNENVYLKSYRSVYE